jgi:hypothetical protein
MLNYVAASPSMYAAPRMQFLRNFVSHVSRHPNDFPPVMVMIQLLFAWLKSSATHLPTRATFTLSQISPFFLFIVLTLAITKMSHAVKTLNLSNLQQFA